MRGDFYTSLHRYGRDQSYLEALVKKGPKLLPLFAELFDKHLHSTTQEHYLIPKKIHQIWLGGELPSDYLPYMQTWAEAQGWEYRLWREEEIDKMVLHNRDLYQLGKNYGEKSDILRLEILYQEGGLYVDVDTECLNIDFFDHLHRTLTFYAGFEPLEHRWLGISNAVFGCAPEHPLLKKLILDLKPHFFAELHKWAVVKTGPKFVTQVIEEFIQKEVAPNICLFPPSYFCPASGNDIKQKNYPLFEESAALHYWSGSWINPLFSL